MNWLEIVFWILMALIVIALWPRDGDDDDPRRDGGAGTNQSGW